MLRSVDCGSPGAQQNFFYNFGEANETAHVREQWMDTATGAAHGVMVPIQKHFCPYQSQLCRVQYQYSGSI
ncbi:MAG: hypothetical protein IPP42_01290 [Saprospiraceae bacterium]|nr:hypothetical protein [Saprospiraceae bacterium]